MSNESSPFDKIEKIKEIRSNNKRYSLNLDPSTNDSLVKIKDKLFDIESVKSKISEPKKKSVDKTELKHVFNKINRKSITKNRGSSFISNKHDTKAIIDKNTDVFLRDFKIGELLGKGSFGSVKVCYHHLTDQKAAVKIIPKTNLDTEEKINYLVNEINILKRMFHPNIIKLLSVYNTQNKIYIVTDYANGGELFTYLTKYGKLKEHEASRLFYQLVSAVSYMHSQNFVHRDIKAENIVIDYFRKKTLSEAEIKLVDFGFASDLSKKKFNKNKIINKDTIENKSENNSRSNTNISIENNSLNNSYANIPVNKKNLLCTPCGSYHYVAPEMLLNSEYDGKATDTWALGVVLFTMVTAKLPFDGENEEELKKNVISSTYSVPKYLSKECADLIYNILMTNPEKRITLKDVLNHPFITKFKYPKIYSLNTSCIKIPFDMKLIDLLSKTYPKKVKKWMIYSSLFKNIRNSEFCLYYLFFQKRMLDERKKDFNSCINFNSFEFVTWISNPSNFISTSDPSSINYSDLVSKVSYKSEISKQIESVDIEEQRFNVNDEYALEKYIGREKNKKYEEPTFSHVKNVMNDYSPNKGLKSNNISNQMSKASLNSKLNKSKSELEKESTSNQLSPVKNYIIEENNNSIKSNDSKDDILDDQELNKPNLKLMIDDHRDSENNKSLVKLNPFSTNENKSLTALSYNHFNTPKSKLNIINTTKKSLENIYSKSLYSHGAFTVLKTATSKAITNNKKSKRDFKSPTKQEVFKNALKLNTLQQNTIFDPSKNNRILSELDINEDEIIDAPDNINYFDTISCDLPLNKLFNKLFSSFNVKKVYIEKVISSSNFMCCKDDYIFNVSVLKSIKTVKKYLVFFEFVGSIDSSKNKLTFKNELLHQLLSSINI